MKEFVRKICFEFSVAEEDFYSKNRQENTVFARFCFAKILKERGCTNAEIACRTGRTKRNVELMLSACENLIASNYKGFRDRYEKLRVES